MKHGFSYAEAEKAVTQLWTEGYDIAETESAISLLVERLQVILYLSYFYLV